MKLAYRTWGKEQFVNDEIIKTDLRKMSGGLIEISDDASIDSYKNVNPPGPQNTQQRRKQHKGGSGGGQQQHGRRFQSNRPSNSNSSNKHKKRY